MDISGKNALVTGAGSGIGRATAIMLAVRGAAKVVLVDIDAQRLQSVAAEVRAAGATPLVKQADLAKPDEVLRLFEGADEETGGLDIVHNNAGVMSGPPDFPDTTISRMVDTIQINLIAVMIGTRISIELMRRRGSPGVIVNTASSAAFGPLPPDPTYSTSKAGIVNFTQSCKPLHELFNIRVMAVCPGITDTNIVQRDAEWLKPALAVLQMLHPDDVARTVCDIISDDTKAGEYVLLQNDEIVSA